MFVHPSWSPRGLADQASARPAAQSCLFQSLGTPVASCFTVGEAVALKLTQHSRLLPGFTP